MAGITGDAVVARTRYIRDTLEAKTISESV
jgi:hypothetical protein